MRRDGSRLRQLLRLERENSYVAQPAWSRRGRIAFVEPRSQPWITLVDATGGDPVPLRRQGHSPAWSPNGARLLFVRSEAGEHELFSGGPVVSVDADGDDRRVLRRGANGAVAFSPDGRRLAYATWNFGAGPDRVTITRRNGAKTHTLKLPDDYRPTTGLTWTKRTR